ncbi:MAG: LysR family transcriptional regulator [Cereibacter sphaeroides]|uniref:LysR family transcriptional regulator n=1 Tax=Cereibacter sphaeroides TaxID=1063 RepID=A0A2W5UA72_CERSP|nr:MAG: LysR family transcriptional regulator [Cereibacter sphaeroides]
MPVRFTLRQLEYLVAVGEAGSIALAAERVNVSSPSISTAIAQLEQEFGLQLFVRRHAQGLSLTEAGRRIVAEARGVLAATGRLTDVANEITGAVRGPLTVGCQQTVAQMLMPRLRRGFADRYPEVEFRQIEGNQADLYEGLRSGAMDAALSYEMDIPADLHFLPLIALPPHALLPAGHPLAARKSVTPAELASHPLVLLDMPFSGEYFLSVFTRRGLKPRVVERTHDMGLMRAMVANGFGYSIANIRLRSDVAPDGQPLTIVPIDDPKAPLAALRFGLILTEGAESARRVRAFADYCGAEVPGIIGPAG